MATFGLSHLLLANSIRVAVRDNFFQINGEFLAPGYWVALSAKALRDRVDQESILFPSEEMAKYSSAIGFPRLVWGEDHYQPIRVNEGRNYSSLTLLDIPEATDIATGRINNCIRQLLPNEEFRDFVNDLCSVVGDLHDNVWSHGLSSGVSMAQKWRATSYGQDESFLEFALADCGTGFKTELGRVGINLQHDHEAIEWCIVEGHSTEKRKYVDDWAQSLPGDIMGNPIPGIGQAKVNDNHHMGLGLAKLVKLIQKFHGQLWLASGTDILIIESDGNKSYESLAFPWKGVAVACRFCTADIRRAVRDEQDPEIDDLIRMLRRSK